MKTNFSTELRNQLKKITLKLIPIYLLSFEEKTICCHLKRFLFSDSFNLAGV